MNLWWIAKQMYVQVQDHEEPLIVTGQCHPLEGLDRVELRQDQGVQRTRSGRSIREL